MAQILELKRWFLENLTLIILFLFCAGLMILMFLYIFLHKDKPYNVTVVTDATLTQFDYVNNNTLYYDLSLNLTITNIVYGYDFVEAGAFYQDVMFGSSIMKTIFNDLNAVFKGHHDGLSFSTNQISKDNMVYHINVKLCLKLRYNTYEVNPMIRCDLHVPLKSHKEADEFRATQCDSVHRAGICSIL